MKRVTANNGVVYYRSELIPCKHGFSTRIGGKSRFAHTSSLNLGIKRDDPDCTVIENLKLFSDAVGLDPNSIISARQIHSAHIRYVTPENAGEGYYVSDLEPCDGYVTDKEKIALGIRTADCVPILLYAEIDFSRRVIAALHAGWRGTHKLIASRAVEQMLRLGAEPETIRAAIGPCIGQCCYEVSADFFDAFALVLGKDIADRFIVPSSKNKGRFYAELSSINKFILQSCGIKEDNIDVADICTCCNEQEFYSHRRSGEKRGTMLSVISL